MSKKNSDWQLDKKNFVVGVNNQGRVVQEAIPGAPEADIAEYESLIEAVLPPDYRRFLEQVNGGRYDPKSVEYLCIDAGAPLVGSESLKFSSQGLGYLYTLDRALLADKIGDSASRVLELRANYKNFRESEWDFPNLPIDFVPVGSSPVESYQFLLAVRGEHVGKVVFYIWEDLERPLEDVFHVADSFDQFLDRLYPCE